MEDAARIGSTGVVRRQAVDISPLRRVNQAIYLLTTSARESAFRNIKTIAECIADELINATKGSSNRNKRMGMAIRPPRACPSLFYNLPQKYIKNKEGRDGLVFPENMRHFKHQILSKSNKTCKILQSSQKRGTHEVSGHFNIIWPNFTPPTARHELPAATVLKTSKLRSEPTDGPKIPPKGPMPNFKSNGRRLTLHQLSGSKNRPTGGGAPRNHVIQIGANESSQNNSNRSPVKF
ncbi:40S ribosomal protein S5-like protein [Cinnamomum micranthum f. kanehirae]|uniref:Small ribosomal subunit protein uS7c n=1 Tax=Cinnamomum micranthum f. kanehirae TaxID=337451 RepID=A0A3S3MGB7_9MAGN|nr:40S ribosomal protein S5-like protein [Cinnamomum micranthum f. kanehirae]